MIRYAVVGAGWISQEAFMPAVATTGNSRMQAIVSGSADFAEIPGDRGGNQQDQPGAVGRVFQGVHQRIT